MANQRSGGGAQPPGKRAPQSQQPKTQQSQSRRAPVNNDRDDAYEREMQRRAGRDMADDEDEE